MNLPVLQNLDPSEREALLALATAAKVQRKDPVRHDRIVPRAGAAGRSDWPLSFAQQRLWFLAQMGQGASAAYHMPGGLRLRGRLNEAALQAALDRIVHRHEALRTSFRMIDGQPVQHIAEGGGLTLVRHDLGGLAPPQQQEQVHHWGRVEAQAPFDLEAGPLIRGRLLRLGDEEHVLLLTMHHIVSDGWSMGVLTGELSALYRAYAHDGVAHAADPLPPLEIQYADYAVWQRSRPDGDVLQGQLDYWQQQLAGAPGLITLPTDRPRPAVQDHAGGSIPVELDRQLSAALKALSHKHGTTLYMTLLAAWGALAARLAGQSEVVIGTPVANRSRVELEPLIGFFVNTLALRLDLGAQPSVAELLAQVRQRVLQAQAHQDLPFEQVVEALNPTRTLAHSPVFQLMFAWQNAARAGLDRGGLELQDLPEDEHRSAKFDLTLSLREEDGCIRGHLEYASALYERGTMALHLRYLKALLQGMVRDDTRAVERIGLLDAAARRQMLALWNDTAREYPQALCIHELFEQQVRRAPQALAVEHDGCSLSYQDLNEQANRLARHLRTLGVRPDRRVAICMPRGVERVVGILAVLKAGGAYVPLDPAYPAERLATMLADSAPVALLTQAGLRDRLEAYAHAGLAVLELNGGASPWQQQPGTNLGAAALGLDPSHLAYVIYTSGSTGHPKGVMVAHRGLCNLVQAQAGSLGLEPGCRVLQCASASFDASVFEMVMALCHGGSLHVPVAGAVLAGPVLTQALAQQGITHVTLTPAVLAALEDGADLAGVRTLVVAGDACPQALVRRWAPGRRMFNAYGPTETTIWATCHECSARAEGPPPIGRPIANTRIYLLDRHGEPVPVGVAGEIHIGGAGVARGYLNRPELTAERFVEDPFHGGRMYRTGDLGRWLPDGNLEFLGRNDQQVKVRGFRIEPGEVEAQLSRQPGVREAAVQVREDSPGDKRLVAYVVGQPGTPPDVQDLRQALMQVLPEYMVPAAYVVLEALPLTPNGKLDRQALPAPEGAAYAQRAYEAPQGLVEEVLAQIWAELLRVPRVGRHDDFFALGGHSLLAVQLMERMRRKGLQADIPLLFAQPTLAALAQAIVQAGQDGSAGRREVTVPPNGIPPGCTAIMPAMLPLVTLDEAQIERIAAAVPGGSANIQDIYPLAPLQHGILFHHLLKPGHDPYQGSIVLSFASREPLDGFVQAMQQVIDRHDILRTAVLWEALPEPVQVVWRRAAIEVRTLDLPSGAVDAEVEAQLHAAAASADHRLDVRQAPMLRGLAAFDARRQRWLLLLQQHHLVLDHTTLDVLFQEMAWIQGGRAAELQPPVPFRNFVAQARLGMSAQEHEAFFRQMLGDVDEPTAPFGLLDVHGDGTGMQEARRVLEPQLSQRLRQQARALGVSAASLFHWAWAQVLACTTGRDDVVFGTVLFGRLHGGEGVDRAMGLFINTLPVRIRLGDVGVREGVRQTQQTLAQLMRHEHASLALAQRCSGLPSGSPLFSALLNYRHSGVQPARDSQPDAAAQWLDSVQVVSERERANYPFDLSVDDLGGDFVLSAQIAPPVEAQRVCDYMHQALQGLVHALEQAPQGPAWGIGILGQAERRQVLEQWNNTARPYPHELCVHELFEQQAARTPQAVALEFEGKSLSYRDLNEQANRLAHHLRGLGVVPEARVAVCVRRSPEMVVGILAVLKAGGAYVPLDPDHPRERLQYMLGDSAPRVLLTHGGLPAGLDLPADLAVLDFGDKPCPWARSSTRNPCVAAVGVVPHHLAYVIYTSGSTGNPKGVMIEHRTLSHQITALQAHFGFGPSDRMLQFAAATFDMSVEEIFSALLSGATLVLRTEDWIAGPTQWCALCRDHALTVANLPTLFWQQLAQAPTVAIPAGLRRIIIGGDAVNAAALSLWWTRPGHRPALSNAYGPTEATINASILDCSAEAHPRSIGRPMDRTRIYVLDRHGQPVPCGVAGEIYIGGAGVARGYLNRPELTRQCFVADPFAAQPGARMYRTGDLGRWLPDGRIEYLGRNDQQVKIRGFRIELGEIEAQLGRQPGVREAVVLAREDSPGDKRLVAYVVGQPGVPPDVAGLRQALAQVLPEYMVPAAYVMLEALPLTPNRKLDRQALPAPDGTAYAQREYEAPQGEVETALAEIWATLLQLDRVGRHDDFFELGGHSLLAVQMTSRVRQRLGLEVALADLFAQPVLQAFAGVVGCSAASMLPAVVAGPRPAQLPLSFAQQRLWFIAQMSEQAGTAYHMLEGLRLRGRLDDAALQAALERIVQRHEVLRTHFERVDGQPVQCIDAGVRFTLPRHDLRTAADAPAQVLHWSRIEAREPFNLEAGPLMRGRLLRLGDEEHVLLLTLHHIASDGWSMGVLTGELSALYRAYAQNGVAYETDPLPALPLQYADYALWQRRWLSGAVLQGQLDYWRDHLRHAPALLELPTDRPRPAVQDHAGAALNFTLDAVLSAGLKALSRRHGSTLYMTLLAGWAALLGRLSGQHDLVIGTPVVNRGHAELEPLIGFFLNTLALRVDLSGDPSVAQLLQQVRATTLAAQAHKDLPFEQVVEALKPVRSLAHAPLYQCVFVMHNTPAGQLDLPGLQATPVEPPDGMAQELDLWWSVAEVGEHLECTVVFATALFDRATVQRWSSHWQHLLQAMVADDAQAVSRLALLSAAERRQLLVAWNDTRRDDMQERLVHRLFQQQAAHQPHAPALSFEGGTLSYAQLNARANRLAHQLIAQGVRPDSRVAIALERGPDLVVAVLATLKAGGAYVPLDPAYPSERLGFMLEDCRPRVVLTQAAVQERLPAGRALITAAVLELDAPQAPWLQQPDTDPEPAVLGLEPQHLAYVIYTSGSTGSPKGVMVEHRSLCNLTQAQIQAFAIDAGSRVLQYASFSFDACVSEVMTTLCSGACLVLAAPGVPLAGQALQDLVVRQAVTHATLPPAVLASLPPELRLDGLGTLVVAGEACPAAVAQRFGPGRRFINAYGPTEATVCASLQLWHGGEGAPSIGRPIANTRIYLLDTQRQPVPLGVTGELYIGGAGVARGYLNRPELTDERFVPDPFCAEPGARMYRSGDLARWLPDGSIEYLGRNDFQVKIRGFRIELGEIEAQLSKQPGVREAAVLAREDSPGERRLVAYVVGQPGTPPEAQALRQALGQVLPEYMVPAAYVVLQALPLTANGKLDRKALPAPEGAAYGRQGYEAPQGEVETALAETWGQLLQIDRVDRHDHFFELGGHSLLAVRMIARLRQRLGLEVALADLFAQPVLQAFAGVVGRAAADALPALVAEPRPPVLPLSFAQQRLWFIAQMSEQASAAYHMPGGLRLSGRLDDAALQAALERIMQRHEVLRTHFERVDGQPVQCIDAGVRFTLPRHDLRTAADVPAQVAHWSRIEAREPFNLAAGPLMRGRLLRLGDEEHVLLLTLHHIASDGWSMGVLTGELSALYRAYAQNGVAYETDPLPALSLQYADYALWQRRWLTGAVLQEQLDYWREQLRDAPALLELPTDRPRPAVQDHAGGSLPVVLDRQLSAALKALSHKHGTTLYMTLLAAWGALAARLAGQSEVVIGTPVANRPRIELEPLIGFFLNTLALRLDLGAQPSVAELLAQVRQRVLQAQAHQEVPFEQVVEALNPIRTLAHSPVFQLMFAWQNAPQEQLDLDGLELRDFLPDDEPHSAKFDLTLNLHEADGHIRGHLEYASALYERGTMERHLGYLKALLQGMVRDDTQAVECIGLLDAAERGQVLEQYNDTARPYPRERCIHELFEQQVRRTPQAPAVEYEGRSLSYRELNEQANRLARHLRTLGVEPDRRVAICMPRSLEMVVGILAVLKAGGAYVPLDPDHPAQRLARMLEDSLPVVVLTQAGLRSGPDIPAGTAVLELEGTQRPWHKCSARNLSAAAMGLAPRHLAYVIYTSGSTGEPKGVMVEHGQVVNLWQGLEQSIFRAHACRRVSLNASISFDASVQQLVQLLSGRTLVIVPSSVRRNMPDLCRFIDEARIDAFDCTPAQLNALLGAGTLPVGQLQLALVGGEAIDPALWARLGTAGSTTFYNVYGPTECTVDATCMRIRATDSPAIGRPIANTRIYVLDRHGQPVPCGVAGEIHIGGAGVARGYLNRPELTRQCFVADPFAAQPGARMYRTGDLGRWLPDGRIEYLGRNDQQVKIRGFRIELGEVEAQLNKQPGVREAVVLAREDSPGDKRLVAYVVGQPGVPPDVAGLRQALAQVLPAYMVPAAYVVLQALPLTPHGKLDRQALPAPDGTAYAQREYEAPQGEVETALAEIWATLLQLDRVGRHDHFFELGGHSLLAVQMTSRVRQRLGLEVVLADLFAQPALQAFAGVVGCAAASMLPAVVAGPRPARLPLSFAQQRLWFIAQMSEQASTAYHMPGGLRLRGRLDDAALQAALERIVQRHEVLRTGFKMIDGQPVQCIDAGARFTLPRHDLRTAADAPAQVLHWSRIEAREPFNLEAGPLMRGRLLRLGDEEHVLLLTLHHIASDGWSMGVLTGELSALYRAYAHDGLTHEADPLPALPLQYADYALWQRRWLSGAVLQGQLDYWRDHLRHAPALLELPTDRPRPAVQDHAGAALSFTLDAPLSAGLRALSRRHGSTLYMTLLAGWAALLGRLSGQHDLVIGTPVVNRSHAELEPLIGFFLNTLALRVDLSGDPSVAQLLHQVRATTLGAQAHKDLPFEQVVEALKPVRSLAHAPLYQCVFVMHNTPAGQLDLPGLQATSVEPPDDTAQIDLWWSVAEVGDQLECTVVYATALFDRETVQRWAGHWRHLLQAMVADDAQPVVRLPLLSQDERRRLLLEWNDTQQAYPQEHCIPQWFEAQAARAPQAPALVFEGRSLGYADLNARANRLAHHLIALGVRPEGRVAVALERGPDLIVAVLAVLKAGGGYVPLDPAYPAERLGFMLEDSRPRVVLTQASVQERLPAGRALMTASVLELDAPQAPWLQRPDTNPDPVALGLDPEHLAYVIYTSGSTGSPKGVAVSHRNLAHSTHARLRCYPEPVQRFLLLPSVAFDSSVAGIFWTLCTGGALVLPTDAERPDVQALGRLMAAHTVSHLLCVPSLYAALLADATPQTLASLRAVVVAGESCPGSLVQEHAARVPAGAMYNEYGPTECSVWASVERFDAQRAGPVSIGRPIANTRIYLLDSHGEPVPVGVAGEIHIGGAGVTRGYLNRPELTAERFAEDPFHGGRMYRTGDLGRWLPDGRIEFLGRNDQQVKVRGFRIELGEIEAQLSKQPGVGEAAVLAREDSPGDKRLVAYLVGQPGTPPVVQDLRQALAQVLPEYMVPVAYVVLEGLPLTPNGKLDRRALPTPEDAAYGRQGYEAPQGEVETALAQIWAEVLKIERVGRHDHFFELGGHSLLAVHLAERMRRQGLAADIRTLFAQPTLAALAQAVGRGREVAVPPNGIPPGCTAITPDMLPLVQLDAAQVERIVQTVPGGAANIQDIYPLAPLQEGILFHHLLQSEGDPYLGSATLAFDTRERMDGFVQALQQVVDRHDILRTAVLWEGLAEPVQVVWRRAVFELQTLELPAGDAAAQLSVHADPWRCRLDVRRAPMMRGFAAFDAQQQRWLLLLMQHHLVLDHTTQEVLFQEMALIQAGRQRELPEPVPFRNYVAQARLGMSVSEHEAFFRQVLGDVDEPTAPFGLVNVQGDGSDIGEAQCLLDAALSRRIRQQAKALGVSAASLFHWAWAQVLARTTGRDDVVFGTVLLGRLHGGEGSDRALGLFINTLPVRIRLGEVGVQEGIRQTQEMLAQLLRHEHAPLALAQRCSALPAGTPLFSALLNYRHSAQAGQEAEAGWIEGAEVVGAQTRTNYPFDLSVDDLGQDFVLTVQVAQPVQAQRVCDYMQQALVGLVEALEQAPQTPAWRIGVLGEAERHQVLVQWNDTARPYPQDLCIHELFEQQVRRTPRAVAVAHEGGSLSYRDLNEQANRLAHHLRGLGVGPDDRVAVCVRRSPAMVVGILAVLKAGGAYVPMDPDYPGERLQYMLRDSAPRVLLTQAGLCSGLEVPAGLAVLTLDEGQRAWAKRPASNPVRAPMGLTPRHLAYVIYTSGSTGSPKGVMVEHGAIVNYATQMVGQFDVPNGGGSLIFTSFSFDLTLTSFYPPLICGRPVHLCPEGNDLSAWRDRLLAGDNLAPVKLTPSHLAMLQQVLPAEQLAGRISALVLGGEALQGSVLQWWRQHAPHMRIFNHYGPTEATVGCVVNEVSGPLRATVPIGRPIGNTKIYLLDRHAEPVPMGVAGEICIGGVGLARGYLNWPELTRERFVPDPFAAEPGARMYKTGDLGRWLPDGRIEYLGRNDQQVKIRGFRIELGEIEAQLGRQPGVREAVVLAREDSPGDKRLVAYMVGQPGMLPDVAGLRQALAQVLPEYMVPAAYVVLQALPLTPNGKLDRKALPAPEGAAYGRQGYEAPQGEVERALAETWGQLLKIDQVGRHDHFFDLGGHSLLAMRMIARLRQRLGLEVALADLFAQPVLQAFAEVVGRSAASALPAIVAGRRPAQLPLSFAQQRLWFIAQMGHEASSAYHIRLGLRLAGRLDEEALQGALDRLVQRHEVLRTSFKVIDGQPVQHIAEGRGFMLARHDLGGLASQERREQFDHWSLVEVQQAFDLEAGPPIRGRLLRLGEEEHVLLLTLHHIASDGWSTGVLMGELSTLYRAYALQGVAHDVDPLPALPLQYADYAVWQRQWLEGAVQQRQLAYWQEQLAGAPEVILLPTDRPRPVEQDYAGQGLDFELDLALSEALKALSRKHGTTLYMTLLAAWGALLARLAGQEAVVVGTPVANRTRAEMEPLIGFFVNTLALRLDLGQGLRVGELLAQVRQRVLQAQGHQDVPFEQVVEAKKPVRSLAHSPVFQVMFAWQNAPEQGLELGGLELQALQGEHRSAHFDLTLSLREEDGRIVGGLEYASALYERGTVKRWLGYLKVLLQGMAGDDTQAVERIAILGQAERQQVLGQWNDTARPYPSELCIHELFEQQAARTPQAPAVAYEGRSLSYRELNEQANRLAHHLRGLGVGPDERVAVCVHRSPEMVVGILAVLKAGGAYVPLDPDYPRERLQYMRGDSAPRVLLTQAGLCGRLEIPASLAVLELDGGPRAWEKCPAGNPDRAAVGLTPRHLAYVIYTSGSTGRPKGVMVEHRGACNYLAWAAAYYAPAKESVVSSSLSFDATVTSLYVPLLCGGTVRLLPEGQEIEGLERLLGSSQACGLVKITPAHLEALGQRLKAAGARSEVGTFVVGGEALPAATVALWRGLQPGVRIVNEYGPTETVVGCVVHDVQAVDVRQPVPIGRPIGNTRIYLLDRHGEPVPVGVAGEIHIGGAGVARGYLNRPELTAERFVEDPFHGGRMYRSGDLARWLPDGRIEYLGRNDQQVKIRGFRIEPGEVEAQLSLLPGVHEAAVLAREDSPGDKRLVAYVVGQPGTPPDVPGLRQALAQVLPAYMVPAAYVVLEALPLTPNGKLDRKALPVPEGTAYAQRGYEAPQGPMEHALAQIWAELLRVDRVGRHDHFFDLGGHSLLAVRMIDRLRQAGLRLEVRAIFEAPTLKAVAGMTQPLAAADAPFKYLVPLRIGGARRPLILAHEPSGEALSYGPLSSHLDGDLPIYGLQADRSDLQAQVTNEMLAERYLSEVRRLQPHGPYRLAGWSAGGLLAYEMARQLLAEGEQVEFLGLIDSGRPEGELPPEMRIEGEKRCWLYLLSHLSYLEPAVGESRANVLEELYQGDIGAALAHCHRAGWLPSSFTADELAWRTALTRQLVSAYWAYRPQPLSIPLHLFRAEVTTGSDPSLRWASLAGCRLQIVPIGGRHLSIAKEPHVRTLAAAISRLLADAEQDRAPNAFGNAPTGVK